MVRNTFTILAILAVLLLGFGMVSAAPGSTTENGITLTVNETSLDNVTTGETYTFEVTVENNNGTDYNVSFGTTEWTWNDSGVTVANGSTETFIGTLTIGSAATKSVIAKFYNMSNSSQELFDISESVSLSYYNDTTEIEGCTDDTYDNYDPAATVDDGSCANTPASGYNFCETAGMVGDLEIIDVSFNNLGEGDDEDWYLLDEIEIEVEVENTHNTENVKDVLVEIMILDDNDDDVTKDFDFDKDEIDLNTIKDDESETATFRIDEVPADLDSGDYKVYIKAYSDGDEGEQCVAEAASKYLDRELYQRIDITREDDPAVIVKFDEFSLTTYCGATNVELPLSVYNLGSDKEESVLVTIQSNKLNVDEQIVIENLKSGKKKDISVFFDVPESLTGSSYSLDIVTYYDFDDDEDEDKETSYAENSEDDLDKSFDVKVSILSCSGPEPSIDASLESEAEVGEELIVKTLVTNNGEDNDFVISVSGFESWADLVSIAPQTANIKEGEFVEVMIILRPTSDGTQSFMINAIVDGESYTQPVSVKIAEDEGMFAGMSDFAVYTIIAIIAVLILIFLVLIAKISRKSVKPQF